MPTSPNARWMTPPPVYESPSTTQSSTTLKPYLQLSHLLSLTWLAYPILSLLFVAFRLQISTASAQDAVSSAKGDLLTSCKAAEKAATAAASMPRYMAAATNAQITDAVNGTMNAARATMVLALTIMEAIINFIIDIYRSTFLCFVELVVRGGLSILIGAVQELNSFIENTFNGIRTSIQNDVSAANSVIQSAVSTFNKINPFGNASVPELSIPSLSALQNVTLPTDFEDSLLKLNSSLPTFSDLKNSLEDIIDTPFELLKKDINDTFAGLGFNVSALPVPAQNTVSFCADMDTSVVDDLGNDIVKIAKIGIVLLVVAALLLLGANCAFEWYKWRCLRQHLQYTREAWMSDPTVYHSGSSKPNSTPVIDLSDHNLLMLHANSAHPLLMRIANNMTRLLRLSPSQHTHLQFFFHYVFHPPALACFLIGFFGLLSVQIQLFAIYPLERTYANRAAASAQDFSTTIATSINASMYNQSASYANDINTRVDHVQSTINDGMFGWVNVTTTTLNSTINTFYTDIQDAVTTVFNGTILESPVQEFIRCFIGSKVDAIETALTFLHDNLHVDIPRVNDTILVLSPADVNEATQPIADAAVGNGTSDDQGVVGRLVASYVNSLKKERIMFSVFMGLWGIVVLMALAIIFWHSYGRDWLEAHRRYRWRKTQRAGIDGIVVPFRERTTGSIRSGFGTSGYRASKEANEQEVQRELPSFTPMPEPQTEHNRSSVRGGALGFLKPHPLSVRKPEYEKSWDSFLDHASLERDRNAAKARGSNKFAAMVQKVGQKRHADSGDIVEETAVDPEEYKQPWYQRVAGMFHRKEQSVDQANAEGMTEGRTRPALTISTSRSDPATIGKLPTIERTSPSSAWSMSPGPTTHALPWLSTIAPTQKSPTTLFKPKSRRTASVPTDVDSVYGSPAVTQARPYVPVPIPLHYGSDFSVTEPLRLPSSPPKQPPMYRSSQNHAQRNANLAPPPLHPSRVAILNPDTSAPVTRLLTTNHARHSSLALDPFVTPFDDENRAQEAGSRTSTNPFIAMAI